MKAIINDGILRIILVADIIQANNKNVPLASQTDLEQTTQDELDELVNVIIELGYDVVHYQSPEELANNAPKHSNDLVLSIYGGKKSRNRMALVPAICETYGIRYIGPDVYGRIISQDKEVSKRLAKDCKLKTPTWKVIRQHEDLHILNNMHYPCVLKPMYEGSSIGITQENLVNSAKEAKGVAQRLISDFDQPILAESFVKGRETAFVAIEKNDEIEWAYSEIYVEANPNFFDNRLFDVFEKEYPSNGRTVLNIDHELSDKDHDSIKLFLKSFGKFGYCRVDGKHHNGRFHFLEFTPDAWIHSSGQLAMGFTEKGWLYKDVIKAILSSEVQDLQYQ